MKEDKLTLGSLFDGSGGFPLGGVLSGITPVFASEVEPFPIRVTSKRFPDMLHVGDVRKLNGRDLPPVYIITFGSPCQDMSIAGRRAGLEGSRSNLFYEAIRIVKEMRCATNGVYPRFIVWENVLGAFSSNKGEDFRAVLETICKIKTDTVSVPMPQKGKWTNAGRIDVEAGFDIAWRSFDAQYWGVPQRRRRVYLVADFSGGCAGKILFESDGLCWNPEKGGFPWKRAATTSEDCIDASGKSDIANSYLFENHSQDSRYKGPLEKAQTLTSSLGTGGNNQPFVVEDKCFDVRFTSEGTKNYRGHTYEAETSRTLATNGNPPDGNYGGICVVSKEEKNVTYGIDRAAFNQGKNAQYNITIEEELQPTIVAKGPGAIGTPIYTSSKCSHFKDFDENIGITLFASDYKCPQIISKLDEEKCRYVVRRLTPIECARLQGFPDWWCDGLETKLPSEAELIKWSEIFEDWRLIEGKSQKPKTRKQIFKWLQSPRSDSAEYKMWGNGVALPNVCYVLGGIAYFYKISLKNLQNS